MMASFWLRVNLRLLREQNAYFGVNGLAVPQPFEKLIRRMAVGESENDPQNGACAGSVDHAP